MGRHRRPSLPELQWVFSWKDCSCRTQKRPAFPGYSCSKSDQAIFSLGWWDGLRKDRRPDKPVERRGRTKSGPIDPYAHSSTSHHKDELWLRYTAF